MNPTPCPLAALLLAPCGRTITANATANCGTMIKSVGA